MPRGQRYTPEQIALIDETLYEVDGNRKRAAEILGMSLAAILQQIQKHPDLRMKWSNSDDHDIPDADDPSREEPKLPDRKGQIVSNKDAKALSRSDEKNRMDASFRKLGLNDDQTKFLGNIEDLYGENMMGLIRQSVGGMAYTQANLQLLVKYLGEKVADIQQNPDKHWTTTADGVVLETPDQKLLKFVKTLTQIAAELRQGANDFARIDYIIKQAQSIADDTGKKSKKGKPGFSPQHLHLHQHQGDPKDSGPKEHPMKKAEKPGEKKG